MARHLTWGALAALGAVAFAMALGFGWGRGVQIGSAPLPVALSLGLVIVSILGLAAPSDTPPVGSDWRAFISVVAAVVLFILTVDRIGLIPASVICMTTAYLGQAERRYTEFVLYAMCFSVGVWLLFGKGLGLPVPAFGG